MSAKPSFCESFNPRKPKPPYRTSIMTAFTKASTGLEAGSSFAGKIGRKEPGGKKTLIAAKVARAMMRLIYILTDRDIFFMAYYVTSAGLFQLDNRILLRIFQ